MCVWRLWPICLQQYCSWQHQLPLQVLHRRWCVENTIQDHGRYLAECGLNVRTGSHGLVHRSNTELPVISHINHENGYFFENDGQPGLDGQDSSGREVFQQRIFVFDSFVLYSGCCFRCAMICGCNHCCQTARSEHIDTRQTVPLFVMRGQKLQLESVPRLLALVEISFIWMVGSKSLLLRSVQVTSTAWQKAILGETDWDWTTVQ